MQNVKKQNWGIWLLTILLVSLTFRTKAQEVKYKTIGADVDYLKGNISIGPGMYLLGLNGFGFSGVFKGNYDLRPIPLTIRAHADVEILSLGENTEYDGRVTEIDAGVLFPILPGKKKTKAVRVDYDRYYTRTAEVTKYLWAQGGEVRTDLVARGGLYALRVAGAANNGFTLGIGTRKRQHVRIALADSKYTVHKETQLYLDMIYFPAPQLATEFGNATPPDPTRTATNIGARIGGTVFEEGRSRSFELSMRPFDDTFLLTLQYSMTFGVKL